MKSYDIENLELIPLLFQTGYLTIKKIEGNKILVLGFPKNEVEEGLYTELIKMFSDKKTGSPIISNLEFKK